MYSDKERKKIQRKLATIGGYKAIAERLGKSSDAIKMIFSSPTRYNKEVYDTALLVIKDWEQSVKTQKKELMAVV